MTKPNGASALTPDQSAAHDFLVELRTRIAVQPLPYKSGVEAAALQSLFELFGHARAAMKKYPGCAAFADKVTAMLNTDVRPVTAKWHRALEAGRLQSRDGSDEFRADLKQLQEKLHVFASDLHAMAYGSPKKDVLTPAGLNEGILKHLMTEVLFGIEPSHTPKAADINTAEALEIHARRGKARPGIAAADLAKNAVGVALSGGGIRSATFCLGAMQVLAWRKLFKDIDFMSTVSGGGYTGSFLTTTLVDGPASGGSIDDLHENIAGPYGPDPGPVRYVRQHAKYLMANGLLQQWTMVAGALAGLLLNWTVPVGLVAALALAAVYLRPLISFGWADLFLPAGVLCAVAFVVYAVSLRLARIAGFAGWLLAGAFGSTGLLAAAWAIEALRSHVPHFISDHVPILGLSAIAASAGPILVRFLPFLQKPIVRTTVLKILLLLAGILLPVGAIVLFYAFVELARAPQVAQLDWPAVLPISGQCLLAAIVAGCAVIGFFLLNINRTAPHWLYRGFLSKAFVEGKDGTIRNLSALGCKEGAPYHLLNAAVNLPSSERLTVRDRKTDFFLFSPRWCGAPTIDYWPTKDWQTNGRELDLSTAMAVSGAAFSSHMGLGSMPTLTAMLTFLNVRLGFWLRKPPHSGGRPGFLCLLREMTGIKMSEEQAWLNLSDGGHIENMAVYELLRRRCKFIVCIDGEADPAFTFPGLLTLVRHAQIDFGIRIDPKLDDLRLAQATRCCKTHFVFCRIHYPKVGAKPAAGDETEIGLRLYVKLSLTGNESELINRYRITHPEFPHQSTLDQFFDEEQFEAYRELGVHALDGLFSPALVGTGDVTSIPDWFKRLAGNLLDPLAGEQKYASAEAAQP
jgi:hypothetical protein